MILAEALSATTAMSMSFCLRRGRSDAESSGKTIRKNYPKTG
jgi:hypothetical protein